MKKLDIQNGRAFGLWAVCALGPPTSRGMRRFWCECKCGARSLVRGSMLLAGRSEGCRKCRSGAKPGQGLRHGACFTRTYSSWRQMLNRCRNPRHHAWNDYGGRGITVCERWLAFEHFLADMGTRPPERSIDRINNDGNYEPSNCRWATASEQQRNKRKRRSVA